MPLRSKSSVDRQALKHLDVIAATETESDPISSCLAVMIETKMGFMRSEAVRSERKPGIYNDRRTQQAQKECLVSSTIISPYPLS